jgi:hypothetical protein
MNAMNGIEELKKKIQEAKTAGVLDGKSREKLILVFEDGSEEELGIQYIKMASKGDTIFGTRLGWFIATNLLYETYLTLSSHELLSLYAARVYAFPLKYNLQRNFCLVKVLKVEVEKTVVEDEEKLVRGFEIPYKDFIIRRGEVEGTKYLVRKLVQLIGDTVTEKDLEKSFWTHTFERGTEAIWSNDKEVRYDIRIFDPILGLWFEQYGPERLRLFKGIPKKDMLRISKAFVIAYPMIEYKYAPADRQFDARHYALYKIFYDGSEYEIPFFGNRPNALTFRITARRFALSKHYRNAFGVNIVNAYPWEFVQALHYLKDFDYESIEVKDLSPYERFIEMFFVRTPARKLEHVKNFMKAADTVKKLVPDSDVTLYVTFVLSKKARIAQKEKSYSGFRYKPGEGLQVLQSAPPTKVTAIAIKGDFEKDYIKFSGLGKLMEYQFGPTEKKLEILRKDIEELREMVKAKAGKDLLEMHPEKEIIPIFGEIIASTDKTNNIAVLILKQTNRKVKVPSEVLLKLAGLIKTGRPEDFTKDRLADILKYARIAVKYEIKRHGYSSKTGVIFAGSPEEIVRKVLEVIRGMPERLAKLVTDIETIEREVKEIHVPIKASSRIEALRFTSGERSDSNFYIF